MGSQYSTQSFYNYDFFHNFKTYHPFDTSKRSLANGLARRVSDLEEEKKDLERRLEWSDEIISKYEEEDPPPISPRDSSFDYQTYFFSQDYFLPNHEITVPIILPPNLVDSLSCPITHEIIHDPWIDYEGNTYEKTAILTHLKKSKTSPITRNPLDATPQFLFPNRQLYNIIQSLRTDNNK